MDDNIQYVLNRKPLMILNHCMLKRLKNIYGKIMMLPHPDFLCLRKKFLYSSFLHVKAKTAAGEFGTPAYSSLSTAALHTGATAREGHCLRLYFTCQSV